MFEPSVWHISLSLHFDPYIWAIEFEPSAWPIYLSHAVWAFSLTHISEPYSLNLQFDPYIWIIEFEPSVWPISLSYRVLAFSLTHISEPYSLSLKFDPYLSVIQFEPSFWLISLSHMHKPFVDPNKFPYNSIPPYLNYSLVPRYFFWMYILSNYYFQTRVIRCTTAHISISSFILMCCCNIHVCHDTN